MSQETFTALVNNAALLVALVLLYETLPLPKKASSPLQQLLAGWIIGGIAIAAMLNPWRFAAGVIFDTRSVLLSLSGLYFGVLPTLVAAFMAAVFRIYLGGDGAFTGVSSILLASAFGLLRSISRTKQIFAT